MKSLIVPLVLFAAAWPALAQEVASDAPVSSGAVVSDAAPSDPLAEATDPVARWEADPAAILEAAEVDLAAFQYLARPLVIFADSPRQPQLAEQLRLLQMDPEALARRDVALIVDSDPAGGSALRRELRPRGFGVVLVDKDGRVMLRQPAPLDIREIGRAIDRTPLRQEELRTRRE